MGPRPPPPGGSPPPPPREAARRGGEAEGCRAVCSAPILLADGPFGVLTVYRDEPHAFSDREVGLLSAFADQAAVAITNARLFRQEQGRRRQGGGVRAPPAG